MLITSPYVLATLKAPTKGDFIKLKAALAKLQLLG